MNANTSTDLPPLQPRHFADLETLTDKDLEANIRDFNMLQDFKSQQPKKENYQGMYTKCLLIGCENVTEVGFHNTRSTAPLDNPTLEYFIRKGSHRARRLYEGNALGENIMTMIKKHDEPKKIIAQLANGHRINEDDMTIWDPYVMESLKSIVTTQFKKLRKFRKSQLDMDTRLCHAFFITDKHEKAAFLETCVKKYPDEVAFPISLSGTYHLIGDYKKSIAAADLALKKFPTNITLLKYKGFSCFHVTDYKEGVDTCKKLLDVASHDYDYLSETYYRVALGLLLLNSHMAEVEKYFKWGVDAENERLPFVSPPESSLRELLENFLCTLRPGEVLTKAHCQYEEKGAKAMHLLLNSFRVVIIRNYREDIMKIKKGLQINSKVKPKIRRKKLLPLENFQFVSLEEMLNQKNGRSDLGLKCIVVEEAIVVNSLVRLVVEDEKGDIVKGCIKSSNKEFAEKFVFMKKIIMLNPYVWRDKDEEYNFEIWMGGEDYVKFEEEKALKRCRFCWKKGVLKKCAKCKKCSFCSKECQEMDWWILKHEYICEE